MCDNFYNKLNSIYHKTNSKNNHRKNHLYKSINKERVLIKNSSLPDIHEKYSSK